MAVLIDTSIFIALERRRLPLQTLRHLIPEERVAIAAISASELLVGVHRADTSARRARREAFVEAVLEVTPVLPFDLACARLHASMSAALTHRGLRIGAHDLIIAATAALNQLAVFTDNVREFDRIAGLKVVKPDWNRVPAQW